MWIASSLVGPAGARPPPKPTTCPQMRTSLTGSSAANTVAAEPNYTRTEARDDEQYKKLHTIVADLAPEGATGVIRFPRHSVSVERTRRRREFTARARRLPRPGRHRRLLLSRSADPDLCNDRDQSPSSVRCSRATTRVPTCSKRGREPRHRDTNRPAGSGDVRPAPLSRPPARQAGRSP